MFPRVFITGLAAAALAFGAFAQTQSNQDQQPATSSPAGSPAAAQSTANSSQQHASKHTKSSSKKNKKAAANPILDLDSKQPDKVLYDRAVDSIQHHKYDVARLSLQTLINTYPDSEYVARAKLAIADSWYEEGGTAALSQAESEYKDFITFFPNMPEAAEAQMKIANIHYKEMEKADRDPTHAKRAEEEYRQVILQFPDSKLVPQAKERLLQVQEVLADREYQIGHFYFMHEAYPAAIARLKSLVDTYPLYSGADDALYDLGQSYEREVILIGKMKMPEGIKGPLMKFYTHEAQMAYDRILTRYPLADRSKDARKRLEAMKVPVPKATEAAIAQNKAEIASRHSPGTIGKVMENFRKNPDVSAAVTVGEPTLVDPKQVSAPDLVRGVSGDVMNAFNPGGNNVITVEKVQPGAAPPESAPVPRSDASGAAGAPVSGSPAPATTAGAVPELKNQTTPAAGADPDAAPAKSPPQINDAAPVFGSDAAPPPAAASSDSGQSSGTANPQTESTSKHKKKKHLGLF